MPDQPSIEVDASSGEDVAGRDEALRVIVALQTSNFYQAVWTLLTNRADAMTVVEDLFVSCLSAGDRDRIVQLPDADLLLWAMTYAAQRRDASDQRAEDLRLQGVAMLDDHRERRSRSGLLAPSTPIFSTRLRQLEIALRHLPLRLRQVFVLRCVSNFTVSETARVLVVSAGAVEGQLAAARRQLLNSVDGQTLALSRHVLRLQGAATHTLVGRVFRRLQADQGVGQAGPI